jgi:pimeloyl-ACP methyl ester carboxylesterase
MQLVPAAKMRWDASANAEASAPGRRYGLRMDETFTLPAQNEIPEIFVRRQPPETAPRGTVLYVHGATFPSALSIAYRFDGRSWMDELVTSGFDCWGFDFAGYGHAGRYPAMNASPDGLEPLGRVPVAVRQLGQVVQAILDRTGQPRLSIVAHSWGTLVTGRFAAEHPDLIDRLILFGAIAWRQEAGDPPAFDAWYPLTTDAQYRRFVEDVPRGHPMVLLDRHFARWAPDYLATDPTSAERTPPTVRTPSGPLADIQAAWHGDFPYDPGHIRAPALIVRGEWDSLCTDADARWLFDGFSAAPIRRDVKIGAATHLMHLEESRYALYRETETFLAGHDLPASAPVSESIQQRKEA